VEEADADSEQQQQPEDDDDSSSESSSVATTPVLPSKSAKRQKTVEDEVNLPGKSAQIPRVDEVAHHKDVRKGIGEHHLLKL
jgi:hypothetical protein